MIYETLTENKYTTRTTPTKTVMISGSPETQAVCI